MCKKKKMTGTIIKDNANMSKITLVPFFLFKLYFGTKLTSKFNIFTQWTLSFTRKFNYTCKQANFSNPRHLDILIKLALEAHLLYQILRPLQ